MRKRECDFLSDYSFCGMEAETPTLPALPVTRRQLRSSEQQNPHIVTKIPPIYLIGLMGVDIDHPDKEYWKDKYLAEYTFREKGCHDLLGETIVIIFAELARFRKSEDECVTKQDRLLYLLKNSRLLKVPPKWVEESGYKSLLDAMCIEGFDDKKLDEYKKNMYDEKRHRGEIKGERKEERRQIAAAMLAKGLDVEMVAECTKLTIDEVKALQ